MKVRFGFVSNSSSCSFYIQNNSDEVRNLFDFIKENEWMVKAYNHEYGYGHDYKTEDVLAEAEANYSNEVFQPGEQRLMEFADNDAGAFERILHCMLDGSGDSQNWKWCFHESHH